MPATQRLPVLFISHGGGPWPFVDTLRPLYAQTEWLLRRMPERLPARAQAIVMISGHWESPSFAVASHPHPPMVYDYSGFPPHTYAIDYPAPGDAALSRHAVDLIAAAGIDVTLDPKQGFDHGVFVPLSLMYPEANVPVVMVSIHSAYDPAAHLALGRALAPLREEGVLIIGSGLNYHNMRGFGQDRSTADATLFTQYLNEALTRYSGAAREAQLERWTSAPRARLAHPREDHLLPLLVAAGAAGPDRGRILIVEDVMNIPMTSYGFGDFVGD